MYKVSIVSGVCPRFSKVDEHKNNNLFKVESYNASKDQTKEIAKIFEFSEGQKVKILY